MPAKKRVPHQHLGPKPDSMIGKTVYFDAPGDVKAKGGGAMSGVIVDEVWVPELGQPADAPPTDSPMSWGDYYFFAQRIRWPAGDHSVRLGYYRRRAGETHWEFASQTTINSNPRTVMALLEETLKNRDWFG